MSKKSTVKQPVMRRSAVPKVAKDKHGGNILLCPFCPEPHPISPYALASCGTTVEVTALQTVYKAKYRKNMVCAKCGQGGGDMVLWNDAFLHVPDCRPEIKALAVPPKFSKFAETICKMSDGRIKTFIQKRTGTAMPVEEVEPNGTPTGKILGYYFMKVSKKNG